MPMNRRWVDTEIIVQFRAEYYHSWPDAPPEHAYLSALHRHELHFHVVMTQKEDRAIEFIELKSELQRVFSAMNVGALSWTGKMPAEIYNALNEVCGSTASMETIAYVLAEYLAAKYGKDRWIKVVALEDGENGASYTHAIDIERAEREELF